MAKMTKTSPEWQSRPSTDSTQSKTRARADRHNCLSSLACRGSVAEKDYGVSRVRGRDRLNYLNVTRGLGRIHAINYCSQLKYKVMECRVHGKEAEARFSGVKCETIVQISTTNGFLRAIAESVLHHQSNGYAP